MNQNHNHEGNGNKVKTIAPGRNYSANNKSYHNYYQQQQDLIRNEKTVFVLLVIISILLFADLMIGLINSNNITHLENGIDNIRQMLK